MNRSYRNWYLLVALLVLVPLGARVLMWKKLRPQAVDPAMAQAGGTLFTHEWTPNDPLAAGGDGLGPVFNATSCGACHQQGGLGGGGGLEHNVTTFLVQPGPGVPAREGVVHSGAVKYQETLADVDPGLPAVSQPSLDMLISVRTSNGHTARREGIAIPEGVQLSQRNTPALFGAGLIDAIPDRVIIASERRQRLRWGMASGEAEHVPVGHVRRQADGRVGKFGWKAQTAALADFVQAACANELGLGNPGQAQPRPLGKPDYQPPGLDLTLEQCNQLTAFVAGLPRPVERLPDHPTARNEAREGKKLFGTIGCADCHTPNLGDVDGIYSDLLVHRMGKELMGGGDSYGGRRPPREVPDSPSSDGPLPSEWRTPPLWGVADSAPYLHDGRAPTLWEAIQMHGGQAAKAAARFKKLNGGEQIQLVYFLQTLRAP